jgi:predicted lipoprotein with Yx(FWY)xxD motif
MKRRAHAWPKEDAMRNTRLFVSCGLVVLGLAACNRGAMDTETNTTAATTPAPASTVAAPAVATTPTPAAPGALTVTTGDKGAYVADYKGRAVYVLEGDDTGNRCSGDCLQTWQPVLATEEPTAGSPSLQSAMVGTTKRSDGTIQVTYNGHPLYYYSKDTEIAMATGHDVTDKWGEWYLVAPTGLAMASDKASASSGTTAEYPSDEATPATNEPSSKKSTQPATEQKPADTDADTTGKPANY